MNNTLGELKGRIAVLLVGGALIAVAVLLRVWLAATGGYTEGSLSVFFRIGSAVALIVGLLLAGASVAWPMRRAGGSRGPADKNGRGSLHRKDPCK
ncbi:MAG: hypothetical protein V3U26_07465 [Dehalococcoidia bacterium]